MTVEPERQNTDADINHTPPLLSKTTFFLSTHLRHKTDMNMANVRFSLIADNVKSGYILIILEKSRP